MPPRDRDPPETHVHACNGSCIVSNNVLLVEMQISPHMWSQEHGSLSLTCAREQEVQVVPDANDGIRLRHSCERNDGVAALLSYLVWCVPVLSVVCCLLFQPHADRRLASLRGLRNINLHDTTEPLHVALSANTAAGVDD